MSDEERVIALTDQLLRDFADGPRNDFYGAQFDMAYCLKLAPDAFASRLVLDTLSLARIVVPAAASHGLANLAPALGLLHERPHRALPDAAATA